MDNVEKFLRRRIKIARENLDEITKQYEDRIKPIRADIDASERELAKTLAPDIFQGMQRIYQNEVVVADYVFMGEGRYGEEYVGVKFDFLTGGSASLPVGMFRDLPSPVMGE